MQELPKKGSRQVCDNFRGLLISDHLGKAASNVLYEDVDVPYHEYVPEAQCGAVKRRGGDYATHVLRTLLDHAKLMGLSIAILFLVKAFDRVLREVVIGWSQMDSQRGIEYLMTLGFTHTQATELNDEIESGSVLDQVMSNRHVVQLLASMHTQSWFQMNGSSEYIIVHKGGRQGCRYGGVILNLGYAKALKRFYASAEHEGIPARFRHVPEACPGCPVNKFEDAQEKTVFDMTFVDDEAFDVTAATPKSLMSKFNKAITLLIEAFEHYGMTINWKPGKTKAMVVLRGKEARAHKSLMTPKSGVKTFVVERIAKKRKRVKTPKVTIELNVVDAYKHLGSIVEVSGNLVREARNRERSALAAFAPLATKILGSKMVGLKRRVHLAWALIMSRLFFNVHTWSSVPARARTPLYATYMRVWRRVVNDPRYRRETAWSDEEIKRYLGVPSLDCHLRRRRLLY